MFRVSKPTPVRRLAPVKAFMKSEFPRFLSVVEYLEHVGVKSVDPRFAKFLAAEGWKLVDVRPVTNKEYFIPNALEVPIFEMVDMTALGQLSKKAVIKARTMQLAGVVPMEINADFADQVVGAAAGSQGVVLMCENGGSINPACLKPARSISAAWKLATAYPNQKIAIMNGGTKAARDVFLA